MAGMKEEAIGRSISWLAALFVATASEFFPKLGMLVATLVVPQGLHSTHATAYLALAMFLNFAIIFAATFAALRYFLGRPGTPEVS